MSVNFGNKKALGAINQLFVNSGTPPIISTRNPLATDRSEIGTVWVNKTLNTSYIETSIVANVATWQEITNAGGGGAIAGTSLTITPGPISLTGTTTINTTGAATTSIGSTTGASGIALLVGTGNFSLNGAAGSTYSIGAATTTGTISIGGTGAQTGTISIAPGTGAQQVLIADSNTGVKSVSIAGGTVANIVNIGSTTGAASTTINAGTAGLDLVGSATCPISIGDAQTGGSISMGATMTTGTITLGNNASGLVSVPPLADTQASPSATAAIAARVGKAIFTGFSTASAAAQVFTITNALVTAASGIIVTAHNEGANDAQMTITRVNCGAGTFDVTLLNNGTAALNGNVTITFWVLD